MRQKFHLAILIFTSSFLLQISPLVAQTYNTPLPKVNDKDVHLLRQDLRAKAKQLITKNMQLTDEQAAAFWPVYDQYAAQVGKINDTRFGLMKHYADIFPTMTQDQADGMLRLLADADTAIINLRVEYLPKFEQALPGSTKAALFFQLDRRLDYLMNVQMASQLPMIKPYREALRKDAGANGGTIDLTLLMYLSLDQGLTRGLKFAHPE